MAVRNHLDRLLKAGGDTNRDAVLAPHGVTGRIKALSIDV